MIEKRLIDAMHLVTKLSSRVAPLIQKGAKSPGVYNEVLKVIAEAKTEQEWIPVTERLPNLFDDCFVLVKMKYEWETEYDYGVDCAHYVEENGYIDGFVTNNDWNEGQEYIHITHWLPLPEPPKGLTL